MAIEERMQSLINSIDQLTAVIDRLWEQRAHIKDESPPETPINSEPAKANEPERNETELQKLCLTIVRKDKNKSKDIKAAIKKYGGELLKDVPTEKLPELKNDLEALAA